VDGFELQFIIDKSGKKRDKLIILNGKRGK
jgi:hypothetical protein